MAWRSSIGLAQLAAAENSLRVAALLAAAGGFLDAFTYVGHGHVFANAMTGNVVLLAVSAVSGDGRQALAHLLPIACCAITRPSGGFPENWPIVDRGEPSASGPHP